MSRNVDPVSSPAHYFTTHFFSALNSKEGPASVQRWTEKKGINIFAKRFVFVPVNKSLHWSLAVIVNPGAIMHHTEWLERRDGECKDDTERDQDHPFPMILIFDSLGCHPRDIVASKLRDWLNAEWRRTGGKSEAGKGPFTKKTIQHIAPKGECRIDCVHGRVR